MRKLITIFLLALIVFFSIAFTKEDLRNIYSRPPSSWPKPFIDEGVQWKELGILPESPLAINNDSLKHIIELGKILFFDTRLSSSGKISCATCHQPELNWTDGNEKSIGHEGAVNKRNSPSIQNSWFYNRLFWDGRARDLQDQAFAPINSETEMHNEMHEVMRKLNKINAYHDLFKKAFGDEDIDPFKMTEAIATFEQTIISRKSKLDEFLSGDKKALSNSQLKGLHLFRTKARCMNCHHGPLFSDNQFHHIGFSGTDEGYYRVSHKQEDIGKFKTPSLRDVMKTGPWMHDGTQKDMPSILDIFNKAEKVTNMDNLLKPLGLNKKEKADLLAFLDAISSPPIDFQKPKLPE